MGRRRILIVEDDVVVRMSLEALLAEVGPVAIVSRRSLNDAKKILQERFDFAFLAAKVAGEESSSLAYALRAKGVPFAFLTNNPASDLQNIWRSHPFISNPPRRVAVRRALARIDDDLLVA
jgi:DNA-binding response OmpR family regulator